MKITNTIICLSCFVGTLSAQNDTSAMAGLVEAERSFAKMSASQGVRNAFLNFLADDAILFRPDPQVGKPLWQKSTPSSSILKWEPEFVVIALSGDFGFTTGPWELQSYRPLSKPIAYGYFASVWKKQSDGTWKVAVDFGTSCGPMAVTEISEKRFYPIPSTEPGTAEELIAVDSLLSLEYAAKGSESLVRQLSDIGRVHRENLFPITHTDSTSRFLRMESLPRWKVLRGETASTGDLGYTYGMFESGGDDSSHYYYLRFWRKEMQGWRMVLDLNTLPTGVLPVK